MFNWIVTVQTENYQVIEVPIRGYNNPEDAKRAALSQTGASTVLYTVRDYSQEKSARQETNSSSYVGGNSDDDLNEVEAYLLIGGALSSFVGILAPPILNLSIILFIATFAHYFIRKIKEELF